MFLKRSFLPVIAAFAIAAAVLLAQAGSVSAGPAAPGDQPFTQPDGSTATVRMWGDEWQNGLETTDGYTVLVDERSGFLVYAETQPDGSLAPAQVDGKTLVVGQDAPGALAQYARPSAAERPEQPARQSAAMAGGSIQMGQNIGTQDVVVLLVSFSDMPNQYSASEFQTMFFGSSNSIKDFYLKASFNQLTLAPATESYGTSNDGVIGWLNLGIPHPDPSSLTETVTWNLARAALTAANPHINFASFDDDGDGYVTSKELQVIIVAAGYEASYCDGCYGPQIWAHQHDLDGSPLSLDGKRVAQNGADNDYGGYVIVGERHGNHRAQMGTIAHEFGHLLSWPDLYDTDFTSEGVGEWSIMGGGSWNGLSLDGDTPALPDAWSKWYQGWIAPVDSLNGASNNLRSASQYPDAVKVGVNPNGVDWNFYRWAGTGEYWLVENRQKTGYDAALPGCGLLIWHIKENVTSTNKANTWTYGPLVSLEQADGLNNLRNGYNRGDAGDPFPGSAAKLKFNYATNPNSRYHSGSWSIYSVTVTDPGGSHCAATMRMSLEHMVFKHSFLPQVRR